MQAIKINIEKTPVQKLLKIAMDHQASDLQISVGVPPMMKVKGELIPIGDRRLGVKDSERLVHELFPDESAYQEFLLNGDSDFSISIPGAWKVQGQYVQAEGVAGGRHTHRLHRASQSP